MSLDCCLLGNVVAGFTGGTEARDWFTCGNNGTVGTPKIKHIKIILSQKINRPYTRGHCPVLHHDQDPTTGCVLCCIILQSDPPMYSPDRHLRHSFLRIRSLDRMSATDLRWARSTVAHANMGLPESPTPWDAVNGDNGRHV